MPERPPVYRAATASSAAQYRRQARGRWERNRLSAAVRGYDRAWRAMRDRLVIERGGRCEACGRTVVLRQAEASRGRPVAHVDHIVAVAERPDLRLEPTNLRVLCAPCHNARTARDQAFGRSDRRP